MKKCLYIFLLGLGVVSNQAIYSKNNDDSLKLITISFALTQQMQKDLTESLVIIKSLKYLQSQEDLNQLGYTQITFLQLQKLLTKAEQLIKEFDAFLCKAQANLNVAQAKEFQTYNSKFKDLYKKFTQLKKEFLTQGIKI